MKAETEKDGCKDTQTAKQILSVYQARKRLQTANNTLLCVFSIYKVLAHVPNKENGCKDDFSGCKGAKIKKTDKSIQ